MIINGCARGESTGAVDVSPTLAAHLLNAASNEHVEVIEISGVLAAADLHEALPEMDARLALNGTKYPLYHANINPHPGDRPLTPEEWMIAVDTLEAKLGFTGQPRAIVRHIKQGREHTHIVWSRITNVGKLIPCGNDWIKQQTVARALEEQFGLRWTHHPVFWVEGDEPRPKRRPKKSATRQGQRTGITPEMVAEQALEAWTHSDSGPGFVAAVEELGLIVARGDSRAWVLLDPAGGVHSLARVLGLKVKDIRARMGGLDPAMFPSVAEARLAQASRDKASDALAAGGQTVDVDSTLKALTAQRSTFTRRDLRQIVERVTGCRDQQGWMMGSGGFTVLSEEERKAAMRAYADWSNRNPNAAAKYDIESYVAYVQKMHAAGDDRTPEQRQADIEAAHEFDALLKAIGSSPELVELGEDDQGQTRYSTRAMIVLEQRMIDAAESLAAQSSHAVYSKLITHAMAEAKKCGQPLTGEQEAAFHHLMTGTGIACIAGLAGTGKSRLMKTARQAWEAAGYQVQGAALAGLAAQGLQEGSGIKSGTVAGLLKRLDSGKQILTAKDIVVLDESGMLSSRDMERMLRFISQAKAKAVLLGDPEQLQAIEAGAAFRVLLERVGFCDLTAIQRQRDSWQRAATRELGTGWTSEALRRYEWAGMTQEHDTSADAMATMLQSWNQYRRQHPNKSQLMLAFTRKEVSQINSRARAIRKAAGELGPDHLLKTSTGKLVLATGDQIYFTKGNKDHGVMNGTLATVTSIKGSILTVKLADGTSIIFDSKAAYRDGTPRMEFTHGYATTINKSQGATVDHALILASRHMNRHAAYVALSRHRDSLELHWAGEDFHNFQSLSNRLSRKGSKDTTLDYATRRKVANMAELWGENHAALSQTPTDRWQANRADVTAGVMPRDRLWRAARLMPGQRRQPAMRV